MDVPALATPAQWAARQAGTVTEGPSVLSGRSSGVPGARWAHHLVARRGCALLVLPATVRATVCQAREQAREQARAHALSRCRWLSALSEGERRQLAGRAADITGEPGSVLARQWQPSPGMLVLVRGSVQLCTQDEPRAPADALG